MLKILTPALLAILFYSCGISNKNISTSQIKTDSSATTVKKEEEVNSVDNSEKKAAVRTQLQKISTVKINGLQLRFSKLGTKYITGPVVVTRDSAGGLSVDPGGRALKSISDTRQEERRSVNQVKDSTADSSHFHQQLEKRRSDSLAITLAKKVAAKSKDVTRIRIPFWVFAFLIITGIVIWRYRLYKQSKQQKQKTDE
jgi:hypothetical protein